jgi:leucyl-tRNA synthetase
MKILGIDYGKKRLGLALYDPTVRVVVPFGLKELADAVVEGVRVEVPVKEDKKEIFTGMGVLIDSGDYSGLTSKEAYEKMITFAESEGFGKRKVEYKLRDWLISRQRFWGAPIPIVYDKDGKAIPVLEEDLPVILPLDVDFKPTGESPLKYVEKFHNIDSAKYPTAVKREVDTLDTFVDSSWYFLRFCDPNNELEFANKEKMNKLGPVDTYVGGAEHTVLHLLYARFFTKVLYDEGYLTFEEPFLKLRHPGMILGPDHAKMSKSKGNVINPTDTCEEYGADTLRMYEMFMGPLNISKAWSIDSIRGVRKFLQRVYDLSEHLTETVDKDIVVGVNKLIKKVESDTKDFKFNTAVSEFMIFVNLVEEKKGIDKESYTKFLLCLAPYAPFITDELYEKLGNTVSIHTMSFPTYDESLISTGTKTIVVQVNGKKRAMFEISEDMGEEEVYVKALELLKGKLEENDIKKKIYIKGKIVSFVV